MQNPDAEHRTCTAPQYTQLHEKHNAQYKNKYITVPLLNKIERIRFVTAITVVPKEAWVPLASIVDNLLFLHRKRFLSQATPCVPHCENEKPLLSHWLPATQILRLQTWYTFFCSNSYRFYTDTPDIPICHCVYEVHGLWICWQFPLFFFEFGDQPIMKTLCYFSVGLPRTVCAFVSLTLDNILQQYVPRNTVAKFYPHCMPLTAALKNFWSNDIIGLLPSLKRDEFCA